jgi:hypothetical protein
MDYWLKMLGGGRREQLLRNDWMNERGGLLLGAATFPHRPGIRTGDGIVYYGAGHRVVFAAGYATSLPFLAESDDETRWPWRVKVSLRWTIEFIHDGVPLEHLNVSDRDLRNSIKQHSHIRLRPDEYEAAAKALGGSI